MAEELGGVSRPRDVLAALKKLQAGLDRMQAFVEEATYTDPATDGGVQQLVDKGRSWIVQVRSLIAAYTTLIERRERGEAASAQLDLLGERAGRLKDGCMDYFREFEGLLEVTNTVIRELEESLGQGAEEVEG